VNVSLQSYNFIDRFVRHASYLGELTPVFSQLDREDATFRLIEGLADPRMVSFASHNFGNHVLRHQDFRIKLHDGSGAGDLPLLRRDATFLVAPGLADPTAVAFRSLNFPERFLRHRDFHLYIEPIASDQDRLDATFRIVRGFIA
jgi:hypothetical protein